MRKNAIWAFSLTLLSATVLSGCDGDADVVGVGDCVPAANLLAVTEDDRLIKFSSADPSVQISSFAVTGLGAAKVVGLDVRPATGATFILADNNRVYTVDPTTGAATIVGAAAVTSVGADVGGFNFNPVPDRIRLINKAGSVNVRLNPDTGALAATDTSLMYATGDINAGKTFSLRGMAYKATTGAGTGPDPFVTTAYVLDATQDVLATLGSVNANPQSPNGGQLFTVGALGVNVSTTSAAQTFNIDTVNNVGYFVHEGSTRTLRKVNLATGASAPCGGTVKVSGTSLKLRALAVAP
ncbi:DUF4394 domain-containing protein [Stenotrophobium rhamnosiphilum]|nr:DUF4394 domain-containing protein [Stenotrophobium rhamnosiphilum]